MTHPIGESGEAVPEEAIDLNTDAEPRPHPAVRPVAGNERVNLIDSFRGLAILGILMVNMNFFIFPLLRDTNLPFTHAPIDAAALHFISFFAQTKFYIIFSFLFGLGMAVQMERMQAAGKRFAPFFLRRLMWLVLFGIVHGILIWSGDILLLYGLIGFILLLFRNHSQKRLLVWIAILFALPLAILGVVAVSMATTAAADPENRVTRYQRMAEQEAMMTTKYEQAVQIYANGSYAQMTRQRVAEVKMVLSGLPISGVFILTSFLCGVWAWRRGIFQNIGAHRIFLQRYLLWGGALGIAGSLAYTVTKEMLPFSNGQIMHYLGFHLGQFGMGYGYLAALALLYHAGKLSGLFAALANVGRMALTNYLTHSVVFTFIFYSHGLGLHGSIGEATGLAMTFAMFLLQIPFSKWWLERYRFGPMEWLWRSLTYGKRQPMRRHPAAAPTL